MGACTDNEEALVDEGVGDTRDNVEEVEVGDRLRSRLSPEG